MNKYHANTSTYTNYIGVEPISDGSWRIVANMEVVSSIINTTFYLHKQQKVLGRPALAAFLGAYILKGLKITDKYRDIPQISA